MMRQSSCVSPSMHGERLIQTSPDSTATLAQVVEDKTSDDAQPPSVSIEASLDSLPTLRTSRSASEILSSLDRLSLKGKLPGYEPFGTTGFKVALFGNPFDSDLIAAIKPNDLGSTLTFTTKMHAKAPIVLIVSILISIWPGVMLTDSLIPGAWGWWPTWTWYMPLVILPLPYFLPKMWKKSRAESESHLLEQLERIATATDCS